MPFDAIAVSAVVKELNEKLVGGRIEKIHQPEKDEIRLFIKADKKTYTLLISADSGNPRIHLTDFAKHNPPQAPMFCMLLRKHLGSGRIKSINQPDFERVVDIEVESRNELGDVVSCHIFAEIMGRHSNIILVEGEKVIDSVKRIDLSVSTVRHILPGITYTLPPRQDKINSETVEEDKIFETLLKCPAQPIEKAIVKTFGGTSPLFGREVAFLSTGEVSGMLEGANILAASKILWKQLDKIQKKEFAPCIIADAETEKMIDFAAYDVTQFGSLSNVSYFESISQAMDTFYFRRDMWERMRAKSAATRKTVTNALERCRKKLQLQYEKLAECEKADIFKIYGELITSNLYRISGDEEFLELENYYDNNSLLKIPMDKSKTPQKNAAAYYTKYRKLKTAKEITEEQMLKNLSEIEYLEAVLTSIDIAETEEDLAEIKKELASLKYIKNEQGKKGKIKEKPSEPLNFNYEGYEILVGRNNRQNDLVTCRIGKSYDMWLHIKDAPGSHVLIKNQNVEIPDKVIEYAAQLAAYYSSGRESAMVEIDYTIIKNVKKPSGAMPGKVIYDKYKTAYVAPIKIQEV